MTKAVTCLTSVQSGRTTNSNTPTAADPGLEKEKGGR